MNPGIGHDEQFHFSIVYFIHFFGCDKDESMENSICYLFIYLFFLFFLENREDFIQFSKVNGMKQPEKIRSRVLAKRSPLAVAKRQPTADDLALRLPTQTALVPNMVV
jgi:hypothetical protein